MPPNEWRALLIASSLTLGCTESSARTPPPLPATAQRALPVAAAPVHIYVPTGPRRADASCEVHATAIAGAVSCGLHRLSWDPATGAITAGPKIAEQATSPSVSPDGERLVYVHPQARGDTLRVIRLSDNRELKLSTDLPQNKFADWLSDDTLLFSTPVRDARCLGEDGRCTRLPHWNQLYRYDLGPGKARPYLRSSTHSIADPSPHPLLPSLIGGHGGWLPAGADTTCTRDGRDSDAIPCSAVPDGMPLVWDTATDRTWQFKLQTARGGQTIPLESCAHVAWSPDGRTLLCTEQKTRALLRAGAGNEVYAVPFDPDAPPGLKTVTVAPLFTHSRGPFGDTACPKLVHKQVRYCHDDKHIVATVGCTEAGPEQAARYSRVYLIDIQDPAAPRYTDLTAVIEASEGAAPGALRSFSAACAAP